jgi:hypothetical protein
MWLVSVYRGLVLSFVLDSYGLILVYFFYELTLTRGDGISFELGYAASRFLNFVILRFFPGSITLQFHRLWLNS